MFVLDPIFRIFEAVMNFKKDEVVKICDKLDLPAPSSVPPAVLSALRAALSAFPAALSALPAALSALPIHLYYSLLRILCPPPSRLLPASSSSVFHLVYHALCVMARLSLPCLCQTPQAGSWSVYALRR